MEKNKKDVLCLLYVPFAMFFVAWAGHISVDEFYGGAPFLAAMEYQAYFFLIFFARALYTFGDFERYFHGYGVVVVVRHRKKQRLFFHSVWRLFGKETLYQTWALICACLFSCLVLDEAVVLSAGLWKNFILYCLADFVLAMLQMLLEIIWDGRIGICGAGVYYIGTLLVSGKLYFQSWGKNIMWLFLPNLGNVDRMEECGYATGIVLLILFLAFFILLAAGGLAAGKKDIL